MWSSAVRMRGPRAFTCGANGFRERGPMVVPGVAAQFPLHTYSSGKPGKSGACVTFAWNMPRRPEPAQGHHGDENGGGQVARGHGSGADNTRQNCRSAEAQRRNACRLRRGAWGSCGCGNNDSFAGHARTGITRAGEAKSERRSRTDKRCPLVMDTGTITLPRLALLLATSFRAGTAAARPRAGARRVQNGPRLRTRAS